MQGLLYTEEFASRKFTAKTMKEAYLKAMKEYNTTRILDSEILDDLK